MMRTWAGLLVLIMLAFLVMPANPVPVASQGATVTPTAQPSTPLFIMAGHPKSDVLAVNEQGKQYTLDIPKDSDFVLTFHSTNGTPIGYGIQISDKGHQNDGPEAAGGVDSSNPTTFQFLPGLYAGGQVYLQIQEPDHTSPLPFQMGTYFIAPKQIKQGTTVQGALAVALPYQSYQFPGKPTDVVTIVAEETRGNGSFLWLTHLVDQSSPSSAIDISNQPIRGSGVFLLNLKQQGDFHLLVGAVGLYSLQVIHNDLQTLTPGAHQTRLSDQNPTTIWQFNGQEGSPTFLKGQLISGGGASIRALQYNTATNQFDELASFAVSDQAVQLTRELKIPRYGPVYVLVQIPPAYFKNQVSVAVSVSDTNPNATP